jgi:predicted transcriptional regulator YdeE
MLNETLIALPERTILGLACRTSATAAARDIPAHWQRVLEGGGLEQLLPVAGDPAIYAVYSDYESDWRGAYTFVIGMQVAPESRVPEGLAAVCIPAGRYANISLHGNPKDILWRTWSYIGETWAHGNERRYAADYERYLPAALAGMATRDIDIEVGVGLT